MQRKRSHLLVTGRTARYEASDKLRNFQHILDQLAVSPLVRDYGRVLVANELADGGCFVATKYHKTGWGATTTHVLFPENIFERDFRKKGNETGSRKRLLNEIDSPPSHVTIKRAGHGWPFGCPGNKAYSGLLRIETNAPPIISNHLRVCVQHRFDPRTSAGWLISIA